MMRPSTFRFHGRTPLLMALLVCLISLPAIVGWKHSDTRATSELENRNMATLPPLQLLRQNAREYIRATDTYLKDTVGFRLQANALYRKLRYFVFRDPPLANVTIGRDGHVFLNAPRPSDPYAFFHSLCVQQGNPSPQLLEHLTRVMSAATGYFEQRGAKATFAIAPSTLSLYADMLPRQVPPEYRERCLAYPHQDHALAKLEREAMASGNYQIFYPYTLFAKHKTERGFYPKERYHWEGLSAYLFARHLIHASGVVNSLLVNDPSRLGQVKDDIATFFGFVRPVEGYVYPYEGQLMKVKPERWLNAVSQQGRLSHSTTVNSLTRKSALMIANSFGIALAPHLARGFEHFYYLELNTIAEQEQDAVFAAIAQRLQPDYVFFVFDDVNVTNIPKSLEGFIRLQEVEGQQDYPSRKGSGLEKSGQ